MIILISSLIVYLLNIVDFDFFEFKLSIKAILRQELTLEELKESKIYRNYNMIEQGVTIGELNKMFNKEGQPNETNLAMLWKLPYGSFGVLGDNENIKVIHKGIHIKNPPTKKMDEKTLYDLLNCKTLYDVNNIFGEPLIQTSILWNHNGDIEIYSYSWYIETNISKDLTKKMDDINIKKKDIYYIYNDKELHGKGRYKFETNINPEKKIRSVRISRI